MFIKLEFKAETEKAYQLDNGSWIPKSILDKRGLKHPYYEIKDWWLSKCAEKIQDDNDTQILNVFKGLKPLVVKMIDIPEDIREYWGEYWSTLAGEVGMSTPDYEPRIWGNDCFPGEMSSWFD